MPATYEPIATTTLGSAASTITFSSIPGTYTDLRLVLASAMTTGNNDVVGLVFNNDTATNYSQTFLIGDGANASSSQLTSRTFIYLGRNSISSTISLETADIFNYAGSTFKTTLVTQARDANGSGYIDTSVGLWRSTSAITSIKIQTENALQLAIGTTATLYGILKA